MPKTTSPTPYYEPKILPALRRIQEQFGYLKPEELRRFSKREEIPLYRLQEVASFFPHFRLAEAPAVTVRVCRDMACHMNGSASLTQELAALANELNAGTGQKIAVEGVSCLGRCDRPVAVSVSAASNRGRHEEFYCLERDAAELKRIVGACADGTLVPDQVDSDAGRSYPSADWLVDPYKNGERDYGALRKVVAMRDDALRRAAEASRSTPKQPAAKAGDDAARGPGDTNSSGPDAWVEAVLAEMDAAHSNLRGMGGAGIPRSRNGATCATPSEGPRPPDRQPRLHRRQRRRERARHVQGPRAAAACRT